MKQLTQSKFKKGTTEYQNIASPNGEVKSFKVESGQLKYSTDYSQYNEIGKVYTAGSGINLSGTEISVDTNTIQAKLTFDNAPTQNSDNPVKSGGVYTALGDKQDTLVSGTNIKTVNNTSLLGSGNITIQGAEEDNSSITKNAQDKLQAVGVIDQKTGNTDKVWTGTKQEYDAILNKDTDTLYIVTDAPASEVTASDIDSESATSGQVLTADGSGGASWQTASGGSLYMHILNLVYFRMVLYKTTNNPITKSDFASWLYNNNMRNSNTGLPVPSSIYTGENNQGRDYRCVWSDNGTNVQIGYQVLVADLTDGHIGTSTTAAYNVGTITDTVIPM